MVNKIHIFVIFLQREGKESIAYKDWTGSNWLTLLRNFPVTFSLLFCWITLMYLYYVGKANKINKIV